MNNVKRGISVFRQESISQTVSAWRLELITTNPKLSTPPQVHQNWVHPGCILRTHCP